MFKKITRYIVLNFIFNIVSKLLSFILSLKKQRIIFVREDRIGHQAGGLDVELRKSLKIKNKLKIRSLFVFYELKENVANIYLRKLFIKELSKFGFDTLVIKNLNKFHSKILYLFIVQSINKESQNAYIKFASNDIGRRINNQIIYKSNSHYKICDKLNINPSKYICIYSRDSNYLRKRFPNIDWGYHNHRNSDIKNFKKFAKYASENLGFSIVRIGSNPLEKIEWEPNENPCIVDYSFSQLRSEKNDIDLIAGCTIFFSNGGGPESVAIASRRNIIKINQIPLGDTQLNDFGIWIPKIHKIINTDKYLSLMEICKINLQQSTFSKEFIDKNIYLHQNQPDDILNIFLDYLKYKSNSFDEEEKSLICKYHHLRKVLKNRWGILKNRKNFIAPSFLIKYRDLLKS